MSQYYRLLQITGIDEIGDCPGITLTELAVMVEAIRSGTPPPEDVRATYATLADLMGKTILDNMLQLPYAAADSRKHTLDIITTGAARYQQRVEGSLPEGVRSTLTPEQSFQIIEAWNSDPVVAMYMSTHSEDATALIHESLTQQNHDMQTILNSLATQAEATLRSDLAHATTPQERIAAMQKQAPFDISPFESELVSSLETDPISWVLQTMADDAAEYAKIREAVEAGEDALARIDIATYDEMTSSSLSRPEAIQRIYHIIEHRIREGAVDLTNYGQITDPTAAATYRNIENLWGSRQLRDWVTSMQTEGIDAHSSKEIIEMINTAYVAHLENRELRNRRAGLTDMPITPHDSAAYDVAPPDDTNMNRVDDAGAGSESAGEGNGVEVQGGDTMTQPLVEPDRRGDNAVEVPPSGYTNPSDYNPDGTPITPEGQDAMSEPMVTPDMSQAMAMSDGPIIAATAQPDATLPDGSASLSDAVRNSQSEASNQPPLTMDQVMKIMTEDGPAIEAYIASEGGRFGPDSLAMQTQLHEYIQANPDEVHRIIAKHMPSESTGTYWVWEEIDPATRDAIVKALLVTAAAAAAAGAAVGNTLSGGGA